MIVNSDDLKKVYAHKIMSATNNGALTKEGLTSTLDAFECKLKSTEEPTPRTKTEYVKCECDFFDLKDDFRGKRLFFNDGTYDKPKYEVVMGIRELSHYFLQEGVFLKVEKEIDWRDEAVRFLIAINYEGHELKPVDWKVGSFGVYDNEMIKFCRLVESLTRHIEA